MGAWGHDTFGNDTACDWSYRLEEENGLRLIHETFEQVLIVGSNYLDSDIACEGLAACEVVARLRGQWGIRNVYSASVDKWVESHKIAPSQELVRSAIGVIDRVLTPPSELLELWEEDDASLWRDAVLDLRSRVAANRITL